MSGRLIGASLNGFNKGRRQWKDDRDRDENREWRNNRRDRQVGREEYLDPAEREQTGINLSRNRRQDSFEEDTDPARRRAIERGDRRGEQDQAEYEYGIGSRRSALDRGERRAGQEQEDYEYGRGYRRAAIGRQDERDQNALVDENFARPHVRGEIERQTEQGGIDLANQRDGREVNEADMNHFRRGEEAGEYERNADNAIANLAATGNPAAIEDFYNNMYPDDGEITIRKLENGEYEGTFADGTTSVTSKEELIAKSKEFFMSHPSLQQSGGMGGGMGFGRGSGMRGQRGGGIPSNRTARSGGKPSAYREKVLMLAQNYVQQGASEIEAMDRAHREAGYSSRTPPDEAAQDFYTNILDAVMPDPASISFESPEEQDRMYAAAEQRARSLTENFLESYQRGYNGNNAGINYGNGGAGGGEQSQSSVPQDAVNDLRGMPDTPETRAAFDDIFGQGAAEAILNG